MRLRTIAAAGIAAIGLLIAAPAAAFAQEEEHVPADADTEHEFADEAAEHCVHTLEEGGTVDDCHEAPSPILPAADEVLWGGISFVVLLGVMWKFAFPAVKRGMDARTNKIRGDLDEAERVRSEAQGILDQYQRQLADAKQEANRIIEEARLTAEQLKSDLSARAEAEVAEVREAARRDAELSRQRMINDLRGEVATLAIDLAEKVVARNLDRESNRALVDTYISEVSSGR